jgi:YbbR domain-containing protein
MKSKVDWFVITICLLIALLYWWSLRNNENRIYDFPIEFEFVVADSFHIAEDAPKGLVAKITCSEEVYQSLLKDIPNPTISVKLKGLESEIVAWGYIEKQVRELLQPFAIETISFSDPKDFTFRLVSTSFKKVRLSLESEIQFFPGFESVSDPKLLSDSVILYGTNSWLDSIEHWTTEKLVVNNIQGEKQFKLKVKSPPNRQFSVQPEFVQVIIQSEPFTEKQIKLPVQLITSDKKLLKQYKVLPSSANVFVKIAVKDFYLLRDDQFQIGVNLDSMQDLSKPLQIQLIEKPSGVKDLKIYPKYIEVLRYQ